MKIDVPFLINNVGNCSDARLPLKDGCPERWTWSSADKSPEVQLTGRRRRTALFHPNWSNGTAGVRGTVSLSDGGGARYWEVHLSRRIFGTSMMFGVGTRCARIHADAFVNLLGEDAHSWGLSHKGLLWHDGTSRPYTKPFRENEATTIGLLFDPGRGTLTYFKDGHSLGIAFTGLASIDEDLFPIVCSTAAKTEMTLTLALRTFDSLQDRCRAAVARLVGRENDIDRLPIPNQIKTYVKEVLA
ncbi:hypothetical protein NP493_1125g00003 [Ridgeia piscesae]|uniref:SPRY domain-containing SOCS box protein 3 n=1 Tax=Ridgeia piscesae TaxID=27915 RepID=A0AAD9KHK6_RIDPI|nr:hypothetical protein NP493_1125g00003 [Ridgeia piscesae]